LGGVPLPPFVPGSRSRKLPDNFRHKILLASIAALVLSAGIVVKLALFRQHPRVPTGKAAITSLAVLPLENFSRDPEQEYFTDGMTEALTTNLAQISALRVISRTSALRYRGTSKPMPQIAHELGVDGIVEGSVERSGDRVRISAQLIEASSDRHLWAKSYEGNLGDILSLQDDVARAIAREIEVRLTPSEKIQLAKARAVDPQAHEAYLKGRYHLNEWTPTENAKAIEYFQQAVNRDPGYALAYAGLADAYISLSAFGMANVAPREAFPRAEAAASKALQIDDGLSEAHTALAKVKFLYDWDWPGSRREFQRALELNPNDASAHHWYSHFLLSMGQTDQALAEGRRALSIDPLDVEMSLHLVFCYFYTRQFDQAILQARQGLEMDPNFSEFHWFLGEAYEQKGMYREALDELVKATSLSGGRSAVLGGLGHAYAVSGQPVKARIQLRMLQSKTYVSSYDVALVYAGLGEKNQALTWLERAYEEHSDEMVLLNLEPAFDGLRAEPRFRVLADRLHLLS